MTTTKTVATKSALAEESVRFRGIHHLALNTDDMKMTLDFYVGVLGMKLVHAMKVPPGIGTGPDNRGNPPFEEIRHYFFDMGNDSLLAFFEMPKGAKQKVDRDALAGMQHVSFAMTPKNAARIRARLDARDISYLGPMEVLPGVYSIYFFDPNGIRLEISCQPDDGNDDIRIVDGLTQSRHAVVRELETLSNDRNWLKHMTASLSD
jgi:catechol 2,3-dioxygenase-like lactoylglutathione lyase family enzyme